VLAESVDSLAHFSMTSFCSASIVGWSPFFNYGCSTSLLSRCTLLEALNDPSDLTEGLCMVLKIETLALACNSNRLRNSTATSELIPYSAKPFSVLISLSGTAKIRLIFLGRFCTTASSASSKFDVLAIQAAVSHKIPLKKKALCYLILRGI
jgi:hypothetical protein